MLSSHKCLTAALPHFCQNTSAHFINVFMKAHTPNYWLVYAHNWSRNKSRGGVCGIFPVIFPPLTSGSAIPTWSCFTQQRKREMRKEGRRLSKKMELLERYTSLSKQNTVMSLSQTQRQPRLKCLWGTNRFWQFGGFCLRTRNRWHKQKLQSHVFNFWKYRRIIRKLYGEECSANDAKAHVFSFHVHSSWPKLLTINRDGWFQIYSKYILLLGSVMLHMFLKAVGVLLWQKTYNLPKIRANLSCYLLLS